MATLSELQDHVRGVVDVDSTDLPDAIINVWLQDAYNRQIAMEQHWPFFEVITSLTTVADQRAYAISGITGDLTKVAGVWDTGSMGLGFQLRLVRHDEAQARFLGTLNTPSQPLFYSKRAGQIHLWPTPDAAYVYTVFGYRNPTDWIIGGAGSEPDSDERLHLPMADWALARYYQQQEDGEMSNLYEGAFKDGTMLAHDAIMAVDEEWPLVMSRGWGSPSFDFWLKSLGRGGTLA